MVSPGELELDDEALRSMGLDPDEQRRLARQREVEKLEETLGVAEVRCHDFDGLIERLDGIWDDPFRGIVLYLTCSELLVERGRQLGTAWVLETVSEHERRPLPVLVSNPNG